MDPSEASPNRRYRLIAEIGRGGMAEVFLAVAQGPGGFNKLVVVKKALGDLALQPETLAMFIDEARLAARMNHPNVVQTYEFGEEGGRHFIAMEYLDGQPYSRILGRLRGSGRGLDTMSLGHHLRILADMLAGLHHAHELRDFDGTPLHVVHRDVSPQNVFVTYDGSIKVVDFGIAKAQDSSSRTMTGEIKGKVSYMSPEQVRGEPLDRRADLFAVGIMLWEAVAGRRLWRDLPDVRVVTELLQGSIPSIRPHAPQTHPELVRIIERALHPDREARYPSALAMQRDLESFALAAGIRVDGHEVGHTVAESFDEDRKRVRAVVEAQLGSLRWTGENPALATGNLPQIPMPAGPGPHTGREWSGTDAPRMGGSHSGPATNPTHSGSALHLGAGAPPARRSLVVPLVGVGIAALLGATVAITLVRTSGQAARPEATASAEAPSTTSAASTAPPEPAPASSVTLRVKATPADAKIYLDGLLLGTGTFEGPVARSAEPRVLRVEADGHRPAEERLSLATDLMTSLSLEKATPQPVGGPLRPATTATATAQTGPIGPKPKPTGRDIDSESPYR